jgi:hypothetical protein
MDGKQLESAREIMAESGIDGLRVVFRFQLSFIDANQFLSFPRFFPETIVGDPVKPGRETGFAAKAAKVFVGPQKRFLREIICERNIGADQLAEQTSDTRLVIPDQLRKSVVVVVDQNACNEIRIGKRHARMLGQRRNFVFRSFELPDEQMSHANQERDDAERPGATFPIVDRAEEDHHAESDHDQDDAAPHVGASTHGGRRSEERGRHRLAFRDHVPDGAMERPALQIAEEHDRADHKNGRAEESREDDSDNRDGHERAVIDIEIPAIMMTSGHRNTGWVCDRDTEMALQFFGDSLLDAVLIIRRNGCRR